MRSSQRNNLREILDNKDFNDRFVSDFKLNFDVTQVKHVGKNISEYNEFTLVWLKNINRLISMTPNKYRLSDFHFIDVGCGSSIALIYTCSKFNFKKISGFDYDSSMIIKSKINLNNKFKNNKFIKVYFSDASNFFMEEEKVFLFMFNPFGKEILEKLVKNNLKKLKSTNSIIGYVNDKHISVLEKLDVKILRDDKFNLSLILF